MTSNPILSVVIPTKNRPGTLSVIIDYMMGWESDDFEVVIHDNSDDNSEISSTIDRHSEDLRLRYFYDPRPLDMIGNSSAAIEKARGHFLCFIGDDDGLIEATIDLCHRLKEWGFDSASFQRCRYDWPDLSGSLAGDEKSKGPLHCPSPRLVLETIDPMAELSRFLEAGATNITFKGAYPYNGLIARSVMERVREQVGSYFPGPTPDVSCSVSASLVAQKHAYIYMPLICGGQSLKSAAGLGRRGLHVGEIADIRSLPAGTSDAWSPELPDYWSGFTINAESTLKALENWQRADLKQRFNFSRTIAACLIYLHAPYTDRARGHIRHSDAAKAAGVSRVNVWMQMTVIQVIRARDLIKRKLSKIETTFHSDIGDALDHVQAKVKAEMNAGFEELKP